MDRKLKKKSLFFTLIVSLAIQSCVFAEETNLPPVKYEGMAKYQDIKETPEDKEKMKALRKEYKGVTKDDQVIESLEIMKGTLGEFSRKAIVGKNLTGKPIGIEFTDLSQFGQSYKNFDALGWKKNKRLYIYLNQKHKDAPAPALAALLSHEALHQDEFNSLNEETYAWTLEAAVWTQLTEKYPEYNNNTHPLCMRENTLKKLFEKGNYTNKYIRKTVHSNPGYAGLPSRSPGFENDSL